MTIFAVSIISLIGFSNHNAYATPVYLSTLGVTGVSGTDNGHFNAPIGVAVDSSGNIYVADSNNHRVQKFNSAGVYQSTLGATGVIGTDNSHFDGPQNVAVDSSGNIYVADTYNNRVQIFNSAGVYQSTLGVTGVVGADDTHFNIPQGVAVDSSGNIYVADALNQRVQIFNSVGVYQSTLGVTGVSGTDNSHFSFPQGVAVDSTGNIYVADSNNTRVQIFNSVGVYQSTLGVTAHPGSDNAHFIYVYGVTVDSSGNIYVADGQNQRVQIFNSVGVYQSTLGVTGVSGTDNSHFNYPYGVAVDSSGNLYVGDNANHRVQIFGTGTSTTLTLNLPSSIVQGSTFSIIGNVTYNTNGTEIANIPVQISGTGVSTVLTDGGSGVTGGNTFTTTGVTFSGITSMDSCGTCIPAGVGVLHMVAGGTITLPPGTKIVSMELQDMGTNHVVFTATTSDGQTFTQDADGQGLITENVGLGAGNDINTGLPAYITSIQVTSVSGGASGNTVGISKLIASDQRGLPPTLRAITFTGPFSPAPTQTFNPGGYSFIVSAPNTLGVYSVTASFAGNSQYAASNVTQSYSVVENQNKGVAGEGTLTSLTDTNTGFKSTGTCTSTANDGICDTWKTTGIPYNVGGVTKYYTLAGATTTQKDIFVESDAMTGHAPTATAISKVVTAFANSGVDGSQGIKLIVNTGDTNIPHVSNINTWTDGDQNQGNDYDSIKANYFGTPAERTTVSGATETDTLTVVTAGTVYNDKISGIKMTAQNPTNSTITVKQVITETVASTITAANITPIVNTSCNGIQFVTNNGVGPVTVSFGGSGTSRTLTITMTVYNSAAVSGAALCDVTIPLTFATSQTGTPTVTKGGPAAGPNSASPLATNTLLMAKAQVYHYALWVHSVGTCGPSGMAEGGAGGSGNDMLLALGCDFGTAATESPVPTDAAKDTGTITIKQTLTLNPGSIVSAGTPVVNSPLAHLVITNPTVSVSPGTSATAQTITVTLPFTTDSGYQVNGAIGLSITVPLTISTTQNPILPTIATTSSATTTVGTMGTQQVNTLTHGTGTAYTDTITSVVFAGGHWATTGTDNQMAGTFMHELGHNMGLIHGGPASLGGNTATNCKPNYPSVMSYTRQMDTYLTGADFVLDYSHGTLPTLLESGLVETNGLVSSVAAGGLGLPAKVVFGHPAVGTGFGIGLVTPNGGTINKIDWNGDVTFSSTAISIDLNNLGIAGCNTAGIDTTYNDYNDWGSLVYLYRGNTGIPYDGADNRPYHQAPAKLADPPATVVTAIQVQTSQPIAPHSILAWGSTGSGDGKFNNPIGVEVDSAGNVYVVDSNNNRVEKFSSTGAFLGKWGTTGSGNGQFIHPIGIAIDSSNNVYIVDTGNSRVQKFSSSGTYLAKFGTIGSGDGKFIVPTGIDTDSSGNLYVSDSGNNRVEKFTSGGTFLGKWGTTGSSDGQFKNPTGIDSRSGSVYVSDSGNNRVEKFSSTGTFINKWGTTGSSSGQFNTPQATGTDTSGNVYVVDSNNNRVQKFTSTGTFIVAWGTLGTGNSQFKNPTGIAGIDLAGNIYIADSGNNRVEKWGP